MRQKLKIALFHNLASGGSKREAFEFTRQFISLGYQVDEYTISSADDEFLSLRHLAENSFKYHVDFIPPVNKRLPGLRKYIDGISTLFNLNRLKLVYERIAAKIDTEGYDFCFIHDDRVIHSPYLLGLLSRTPSVYFCAEPARAFYEQPLLRLPAVKANWSTRIQGTWYSPVNNTISRLLRKIDWENIQHASLVVTNSFYSAESIYRAYGQRARVVHLGVDTELFHPLDIDRENFVLSVGAITPLKGYDFLIQSLALLRTESRPALFIVGNTGSQSEIDYLRDLSQKKGVKFSHLVNISDEHLVALYNKALLFLYAPVLEPFGLVPLEALACETPVVAVKEAGVRESILDNQVGYLVERVPHLFANAVSELISNPVEIKRLSSNAREYIQNYWTWPLATQRLLSTIRDHIQ